MLTVLCTATAWLRLTVRKRQMATMSFRTEVTQSAGGWRVKATADVPFCHRLSRLERKYHQLLASTLPEMARTIVTKRRDEHLEFSRERQEHNITH